METSGDLVRGLGKVQKRGLYPMPFDRFHCSQHAPLDWLKTLGLSWIPLFESVTVIAVAATMVPADSRLAPRKFWADYFGRQDVDSDDVTIISSNVYQTAFDSVLTEVKRSLVDNRISDYAVGF